MPSDGSRFSIFSHCHAVLEMYDKEPAGDSKERDLGKELGREGRICV